MTATAQCTTGRKRCVLIGVGLLCALVGGCAAKGSDPLHAGGASSGREARNTGALQKTPKQNVSLKPTSLIVNLDVYRLVVPLGAISRDEEFWKRVDEERLDVGTYDLLLRNGMRVGIAPISEWRYFKGLLDRYSAQCQKGTATGGDGGFLELPMKSNIDFQNIFYINPRNLLSGRSFDRCENLLDIAFQSAPRRPGDVLIKVCPVVRALHRQFRYMSEDAEIEMVRPEQLYELRLEADIPLDNFLIIAPSAQSQWPSSLGATFLLADGKAEPVEHVLLLVPKPFQVEDTQ